MWCGIVRHGDCGVGWFGNKDWCGVKLSWGLVWCGMVAHASSETQGQIVGTRKSLNGWVNGRKNIWHEEK